MKNIVILFLLSCSFTCFSQAFLNLDFEYTIPGTQSPQKWFIGNRGYLIMIDDSIKASFSKSLKMTSNNPKANDFGVCTGTFPIDSVKGKELEFTGKIKTKEIDKGFASLWLRVDGEKGSLALDNMSDRGIKGTTDWITVSIKMKVDPSATNINFGAMLVGEGTAWFDDLKIFIDGNEFEDYKPRTTDPTDAEIKWLKKHIYSLSTINPDTVYVKDLEILKKLVGNSRVIAFGENTHGSSEIFKMKHRMIKYLTEDTGIDVFSLEANMPEAYKLNDYILKSEGNPTDLLKGMYFWTWRTKEMLDFIEWMKEYNLSNDKILFTGFDMQFYKGAYKELYQRFNSNEDIQRVLSELKSNLDLIFTERDKSPNPVISTEINTAVKNELDSLKDCISGSDKPESEKSWLLQNIRIIEQYLDCSYKTRDYYMAENLLWIISQYPKSKIAVWAHNGHVQKTGQTMGRYLADSLKKDYISIGFTFNKGKYTAIGNKGLAGYPAQESFIGTYEYFFNSIKEPYFILDLRDIKKDKSEYGKWLKEKLFFRRVGAMKVINEFSETYLIDDFDLLVFINESSNSQILK